ncbi:MAG TPA: LysM peptidoglycan-binding domain-containing protein [Kribbella sp.]
MNAMIRVLKGVLAVLALAGLGWLLRWMTAGSISGLRTYDLDSLTVLAVGTIAWIAYIWLALAVVLTVLEQVPGVVGALAGAIAGRITTKTARALLRSGLGVAAVTPLTVGVAHAAPTDSAHVRQVTQTNPQSAGQYTGTDFRATEPASTIHLGGTSPDQTTRNNYRATEPASGLQVGGTHQNPTDGSNFRATEPASGLQIGGTTNDVRRTSADNAIPQQPTRNDFRATEPASKLQLDSSEATTTPTTSGKPEQPAASSKPTTPAHPTTSGKPTTSGQHETSGRTTTPGRQDRTSGSTEPGQTSGSGSVEGKSTTAKATEAGKQAGAGRADGSGRTSSGKPADPEQQSTGRPRMGVPDRPTDGAPTRYTDLRPTVPVSVVVREGDSLWSIAARELGPTASNAAIEARWHDWYAANRHVIGNDPDLILPGQVLRTPPAPHGDHLPPHQQEQ